MSRLGNKLYLKQKQKTTIRILVISGTSCVLIILITSLFNFCGDKKINGAIRPVDIRIVEEQVFRNETSIPEPFINDQPKPGDHTVFVQSVKPDSKGN